MNAVFLNRQEAGIELAQELTYYQNDFQAIVLGLPRGGIPVAFEIATSLDLPLDICLVKKLSLPHNPELAIGAIAISNLIYGYSDKLTIVNSDYLQQELDSPSIKAIVAKAKIELYRQDRCYRHYCHMLQVKDKVVIVVDDGLATGLTMQAAIETLRQCKPQKIIVAVPVASSEAIDRLKSLADKIICLFVPNSLNAVGLWYEDFTQISDGEVCDLLSRKTVEKLVSG